jgi:hypothetical protein
VAVLGIAALAPVALAFALLAAALPAADAGRAVLGSWALARHEGVRGNWYHAWSTGLDDPRLNVLAMGYAAGAQALVACAVAALALLARRRPTLTAACVLLAAALPVALLWPPGPRLQGGRSLPVWTLLALALTAGRLWRARREHGVSADAARFALAAFALLLLPRMILNARLYHYGFVLAVPATLLVWAALLDWIPQALGRGAAVVRAAAVAALAMVTAGVVGESHRQWQGKTHAVGAGRDLHYANARGPYVTAAMDAIAALEPRDGTLVMLPEGVMIGYLLRRRTSIPYLTMLPTEVAAFGEDELLGSLQRSPPDFIALVHRDSSEMGPRFFGRDYAPRTIGWIRAHYLPAATIGDPPLDPRSAFGIRVLRRAR